MATRRNNGPLPIVKSLYVYWRIIGLCPFVPIEGDEILRFSYIGIFYTTIITTVYTAIYIRAVANRMNFVLSRETLMTIVADFSGLSVEFLVVLTAWLLMSIGQNKVRRILSNFKSIGAKLTKIGIDLDFNEIVKTLKTHTLFVNLVWVVLYCCDHGLLVNSKTFKLAIWMPFNLPRIVTHNIVVVFVDAMLVVKKIFCLLNEKIGNLSKEVGSRQCAIVDVNRKSLEPFVATDPMEVCGQIHSDLVGLTKMIVEFFSLSIILTLLVHFIQMATDLYMVCLLVKDLRIISWIERGTCAILCCWFSVHLVQTVVLMAISDSTANEANRAGIVLHKMLTSAHTERFLDSAQILSIRLLQRRLNINLCGLMEMRLSVVHRITGMVGTYITVMMQLDTQDIQEQKIDRSFEEPLGSSIGSLNDTSTTDSN